MWSTPRSSLSMSRFFLFLTACERVIPPTLWKQLQPVMPCLQRTPTLLSFTELTASASQFSSSLTSTKHIHQPISDLCELGDKSEQVLFSIGHLHWWNVTEFLGNYKICSRDPDSRVKIWTLLEVLGAHTDKLTNYTNRFHVGFAQLVQTCS